MGKFYYMKETLAVENGKLVIKRKREPIHFEYQSVERFINSLCKYGYDCHQIDEGTLLIGDWICCPPENGNYADYYVIRERYQNEWSSYMTVEPKRKLSARETEELKEYYEKEAI